MVGGSVYMFICLYLCLNVYINIARKISVEVNIFLDLILYYCFQFRQQVFLDHMVYYRHCFRSSESYKDAGDKNLCLLESCHSTGQRDSYMHHLVQVSMA